jgi:hypothetical protein
MNASVWITCLYKQKALPIGKASDYKKQEILCLRKIKIKAYCRKAIKQLPGHLHAWPAWIYC